VIAVMDREADFFELFDEQRQAGRVEILVRAKHDRKLEPAGDKLFAKLAGGPPAGHIEMEIAGLTERPKASRKAARTARQKRLARCALRYRKVRPCDRLVLQRGVVTCGVFDENVIEAFRDRIEIELCRGPAGTDRTLVRGEHEEDRQIFGLDSAAERLDLNRDIAQPRLPGRDLGS